jgi:macrolide transport system ATP-binding/permease protein
VAELALQIRDLRKTYNVGGEPLPVLKGIDLEVPVGDYVAIMGPSGSGKSTFLNILGCLDQATSGEFRLGGETIAALDDDRLAAIRAQHIGFVFQSYNLIPSLTVEENIQAPLFYLGHIGEADRKRALRLADRVGLGERLDHRPNQLSGGQQQRAGIARALINNPSFILADEATGNLDSVTTEEILRLLDELNAEGKTIVMVTHEEDVARRARRIVRLRDGVVQSDQRVREPAVAPESRATGQADPAPSWKDRFDTVVRQFVRPWVLGVKSLYLHPMRSILTVLGIFIGVASVIWLLAIGEGISAKAQEEIARLGATNIIVSSVEPPRNPKNPDDRLYGVTRADYEHLVDTVPSIVRAVPYRLTSRATFAFGGRRENHPLRGVTAHYAELNHLRVTRGTFLTDTHVAEEGKVCVIGKKLAEILFPVEDPLGKSVLVHRYYGQDYFQVIGVAEAAVASEEAEGDMLSLFIPLTTYWRTIYDIYSRNDQGVPTVTQVTLQVSEQAAVRETADIVRRRLAATHTKQDFEVLVPLELLERAQSTRIMFIAMLGMVAAISLVVGGIGIMNIMLATVTERTREIGIRRALGAKRRDITRQFLVETVVLSVVGGLVGIVAGFLAAPTVLTLRGFLTKSFPEAMKDAPESIMTMVPIVVPWSIPLAFGISVFVGVAFGLYPAKKAAQMNPIDALRHVT